MLLDGTFGNSLINPGPMPDLHALVMNSSRKSRADVSTWHRHLGHLNINSVVKMVRNGMKGMDIIGSMKRPKIPCVACLLSKQTRNVIPRRQLRSTPASTTARTLTSRVRWTQRL